MTITQELEHSLETRGAAVGIVPASLDTEDRAAVMSDFVRAADLVTFGRDDLKVKLVTGAELGSPLAALVLVVYPADTEEALP